MDPITSSAQNKQPSPPKLFLKIVLMGNPGVGKTSIRQSYTWNEFNPKYFPTLGADFAQVMTQLDGVSTNIAIWDLSGQQRFRDTQPQYFIGSHAAIVVYDVGTENILDEIISWISRYIEYSGNIIDPVLILQNKIDLISPDEEIASIAKHDLLIERLNIYFHQRLVIFGARTSAKTGENIHSSLNSFFKQTVSHHGLNQQQSTIAGDQVNNGLYVKSAYLIIDHLNYPMIIAKSPEPLEYSSVELENATELCRSVDLNLLSRHGFWFSTNTWAEENSDIYYLVFLLSVLDSTEARLVIIGISIPKDLKNVLVTYHDLVEGHLLNTMNTLSSIMKNSPIDSIWSEDAIQLSNHAGISMSLYKLRLVVDKMIRNLLFS